MQENARAVVLVGEGQCNWSDVMHFPIGIVVVQQLCSGLHKYRLRGRFWALHGRCLNPFLLLVSMCDGHAHLLSKAALTYLAWTIAPYQAYHRLRVAQQSIVPKIIGLPG